MKLTAGIILTRLGKRFNINLVQLCNITNIPKRCYSEKLAKPNLYNIKSKSNIQTSKIGLGGYCLLSVPIVTFILGTWQVQRRRWKLNLIESLNERTTHDPLQLPANLEELESMEYYPIKVKGEFIYEKEFVVGFRNLIVDGKTEGSGSLVGTKDGKKGYCVVTPFKLSDRDLTILVNRGWVPRTHKSLAKRQEYQIKGEVEITGILRLNEHRPPFVPKHRTDTDIWSYRDVNAMAEKAGTAPIYLEMAYDKDLPKFPVGGQTQVHLRNEHLSYIITWYALSASTGYMWYKVVSKRLRAI
ncbi:surfeit locus protein 1 [Hylaeus volcanicus]|uniref:surfeit locus protein 1 n=1 Tax=Hylaeus volcanicus TaxID=313075 RepID=UPI0023B85957|nr:surfeit locus protein 1 [Hylaeus volcanicus]